MEPRQNQRLAVRGGRTVGGDTRGIRLRAGSPGNTPNQRKGKEKKMNLAQASDVAHQVFGFGPGLVISAKAIGDIVAAAIPEGQHLCACSHGPHSDTEIGPTETYDVGGEPWRSDQQ